jgi:RES domain
MLPEKQLAPALRTVAGVSMHGPFSRAVALRYLFSKPAPARRVTPQPLWGMGSKLYGGRCTPKNSFETIYVAKDMVTALAEVVAIVTGHPGPPSP